MKTQSAIIYQGPSLLDGSPIVVVALHSNRNKKTGHMVQTYIIRSDISPLQASKLGLDFAICGDCPMRGDATNDARAKQAKNRTCYVLLGQGPTIVWKHLQKGGYPIAQGHEAIASLGESAMVRLGTYGDPAAVPSYVWESLLSRAKSYTGYSHQAKQAQSAFNAKLMMQSVESIIEAQSAWLKGVRTFRVVQSYNEIDKANEIVCPSSRGIQCADCGLCKGSAIKAKSIAIEVHGAGKNNLAA